MANRVTLFGHLGKDPVVKHFQNDSAIAEFSLATKDNYKDREGKWVDVTDWHNIKLPNKYLAERAEKNLKKGSEVLLEGKLKTRSYDDKDGNKRYITEVVVDKMYLVGKKSEGAAQTEQEPSLRKAAEEQNYPNNTGGTEDDLPF